MENKPSAKNCEKGLLLFPHHGAPFRRLAVQLEETRGTEPAQRTSYLVATSKEQGQGKRAVSGAFSGAVTGLMMPTRRLPVLLLVLPSAIDDSLASGTRLKSSPARAEKGPAVGAPSWFHLRRRLSSLEHGHAPQSYVITLRCRLSILR